MQLSTYGVIFEKQPQHWTILQQSGGYGHVDLSGSCTAPPGEGTPTQQQVHVRVVKEADASIVIPWTRAQMQGDRWSVTLEQIPAGGLYRIETCLQLNGNPEMEWAVRGDMVHHLGVGDLYIIAGQSNSAGYGKGPFNDPPEMGIHLLRNDGRWDLATHPFNESTRSIHLQNCERANPGHSPYLAFAKKLKEVTGWPIGLIQTALGGSALDAWSPDKEGELYRNMLDIVHSEAIGGKVRGVLWYQGESDCSRDAASTYLQRFQAMVERLRQDLETPELPVLTVQLNRYTGGTLDQVELNQSWGILREAQRQAANNIPNVYVIPATDCPLSDVIHNSPAGNQLIGERMARQALSQLYGYPIAHWKAPEIARAVYKPGDDPAIELEFHHVGGYLVMIGSQLDHIFAVVDQAGEVHVRSWHIAAKHKIVLRLQRPLASQAVTVVHGMHQTNPAVMPPVDSATYMPFLSFYNFPVTF
jgi:hypothetical protein